jgi:CDP-glycerol glycerophosphotransferase
MTPSPPLLSVVVPVHQVEEYLAGALDSVLAGAGADVEVIVVDDHSPDGSGRIIEEYARRDLRVATVHLATNVGLGRARNVGLERARGEYVWFVDSDDWLPAGSVPAVLARLAASRPDVLVVDHVEAFPDGRSLPDPQSWLLRQSAPGPLRLSDRPRLLRLAHSACTKVVRRSFLDEIDLRFSPGWYEDCAFTHPLLLAADRIELLDRVCYCYRQRASGAITKSVSSRHLDVFAQYERVWEWVGKAAPDHDWARPELFRLMINHLLVIAGNDRRLPPGLRRAFFQRMSEVYRHRLPDQGYEVPGGPAGLKHALVRRNGYLAWASLRLARRVLGGLNRPGAAAPAPPGSVPPPAQLRRIRTPEQSF